MPRRSPLPKGEIVRRISDGPSIIAVEVVRDPRLKSSARFTLNQDTLQVRVPATILPQQLDPLLDDIIARVLKQRARARKQDDHDLQERARAINRQYFDGHLHWHTIRWVSNMERRLGSCTTGGTTDGDIRISERVRRWPAYVLDYIIAHELAHRLYPHHGPDFWAYLARYPHTERARGFIEGIAYAEGTDADKLLD